MELQINYNQLEMLYTALMELRDSKMPFKLSLILAKNLAVIEKEREFYLDREREFATKFLEFDSTTNRFVENAPGVFKIKTGLEEECREARMALDSFQVNCNLYPIAIDILENSGLQFTPAQLAALECLIEGE